jgi:hypothetical protein
MNAGPTDRWAANHLLRQRGSPLNRPVRDDAISEGGAVVGFMCFARRIGAYKREPEYEQ